MVGTLIWRCVRHIHQSPIRHIHHSPIRHIYPSPISHFMKIYSYKDGVSRDFIALMNTQLEEDTFRFWYQKRKRKRFYTDQKYVTERHSILGPDLATAHFIVARGGSVKFWHIDQWFELDSNGKHTLPDRMVKDLYLEAVDASGTVLAYTGMENFVDLKYLRYLNVSNCQYVNDWFLAKCYQLRDSLEILDVSGCPNITEEGLGSLHHLTYLQTLNVSNLPQVEFKDVTFLLVEEMLPNCEVLGVGFLPRGPDVEYQRLLTGPNHKFIGSGDGESGAKPLLIGSLGEESGSHSGGWSESEIGLQDNESGSEEIVIGSSKVLTGSDSEIGSQSGKGWSESEIRSMDNESGSEDIEIGSSKVLTGSDSEIVSRYNESGSQSGRGWSESEIRSRDNESGSEEIILGSSKVLTRPDNGSGSHQIIGLDSHGETGSNSDITGSVMNRVRSDDVNAAVECSASSQTFCENATERKLGHELNNCRTLEDQNGSIDECMSDEINRLKQVSNEKIDNTSLQNNDIYKKKNWSI